MTLWRYVLRRFLRALVAVFVVIALVILLFAAVENLRRFGETEASMADILRVTLLQSPEVLYQVFPLVLMLASLVTFLRLARTSELVVMRAAGVSALRLIGIPVSAAVVLGAVFVAVVNPFVAASIKRGLALEDEFRNAGRSLLSFSPEGVWLRQADPRGPDGDPGGAHQRQRHHPQPGAHAPLRPEGTPYARIEAPAARLVPGAWVLEQAVLWERGRGGPLRPRLGGGTHQPADRADRRPDPRQLLAAGDGRVLASRPLHRADGGVRASPASATGCSW